MKIAVVAPSCTLRPQAAEAVMAIAETRADVELVIHPQCFFSDGHFAGPDAARLEALREVIADEQYQAVWFARGGYGSNRIAEAAATDLPPAARSKTYLGYSMWPMGRWSRMSLVRVGMQRSIGLWTGWFAATPMRWSRGSGPAGGPWRSI